MKLNLTPILCAAAGVLALATTSAQANLLVNGSFEVGPSPVATFLNLTAGSTVVTGWTVTGLTVDYVGGFWVASDGTRSIDLDGSVGSPFTNGGVAQTFATTPGTQYLVRFDLAGNPQNLPTIKPMRVSAAGQSQDFSFNISGRTVTAVPEPGTWALMFGGLLAVAGVAWRRSS
jgi:choice-of-anchor C domain-containing protein